MEQNFIKREAEEYVCNPLPLHEAAVPEIQENGTEGAELPDILQLPKAVGAYQRPDGTHTPRRGN